jgi:HlyD family secretion protein
MTPSVRRFVLWAAIACIVALALTYAFWPRPQLVDLGEVAKGPLTVTVREDGRTRVRDVYVVSAPVNGRLMRVTNHAGDDVVGGETIVAQLQPTDPGFLDVRTRAQAEAAVKAAEAAQALAAADVERAKAELDYANSELKRIEELARRGTASRAALDRARLQHRTTVAQLATLESALHVREYELERARALLISPSGEGAGGSEPLFIPLTAPVTGRVLRVLQESESVVAAGTPIVQIGDPADLEIVVDLLSTEAVKVKAEAHAIISDWGGLKDLDARVRLVEPSGFTKISALGVEEQRVNVILDLTSPRAEWTALGDGFRVETAIVIWESQSVVKVPQAALFRRPEGWAAFVMRDGRARLTRVELGEGNDLETSVASGLEPGDRVILHPNESILDGARIAPREE